MGTDGMNTGVGGGGLAPPSAFAIPPAPVRIMARKIAVIPESPLFCPSQSQGGGFVHESRDLPPEWR